MCPRQLTMHESTVIDRKDSGVLKCFAGNSQVGKLRVNFVFGHRSRYPSLYTDLNCHDGSEPEPIRHGQMTSPCRGSARRSEEHTSELQSLMRISYAVFCLKKKITTTKYS